VRRLCDFHQYGCHASPPHCVLAITAQGSICLAVLDSKWHAGAALGA
jgi:hypothetical protein